MSVLCLEAEESIESLHPDPLSAHLFMPRPAQSLLQLLDIYSITGSAIKRPVCPHLQQITHPLFPAAESWAVNSPLCWGRRGRSSLQFESKQLGSKGLCKLEQKNAASKKEMENFPPGELPTMDLAVDTAGSLSLGQGRDAGGLFSLPVSPMGWRPIPVPLHRGTESFFQVLGVESHVPVRRAGFRLGSN